jgi:hypothetical protein
LFLWTRLLKTGYDLSSFNVKTKQRVNFLVLLRVLILYNTSLQILYRFENRYPAWKAISSLYVHFLNTAILLNISSLSTLFCTQLKSIVCHVSVSHGRGT